MNKSLIISFLLFLIFFPASSQEISMRDTLSLTGRSRIIHFNRDDFHGDPQFWAATEDNNGILYFGNNDGALAYDGERWHKIFLPNNSSVRSLTTDGNGNIYAGGYNELGLIKKDERGKYYYESLIDQLKLSGENFENIWQSHVVNGFGIFRSFKKLFLVKDDKVSILPAAGTFTRAYLVNGIYHIFDSEQGIMRLDPENMELNVAFTPSSFSFEDIVGLHPLKHPDNLLGISKTGKLLIFNTASGKVAPWKTLFSNEGNDQVLSTIYSKGIFYIGTLSSGIITLDESGNIYINDNQSQRLQDNAVHNIYRDYSGNIWALLNRGIDKIDLTSPVSTLFDNASIYDVLFNNNRMYLATNQGVFSSDINTTLQNINTELRYEKIPGLEGQAWSLALFGDAILVSHDKGLFEIKKNKINKIAHVEGIWKILPIEGEPALFLAVSYNGIYILHNHDGKWSVRNKIEGFDESSRDILPAEEPGTYWICHGYKGVFRIKLNDSYTRTTLLEHFTDQNGLPSPFNINVFNWEDDIVFTTNAGVFQYNAADKIFEPYKPLNQILDPSLNTRQLLQHNGKTWYVQDDEIGYFINSEKNPILHQELFRRFKGTFNRGMELIKPLDNDRVLLGTNNGLYLVDLSRQIQKENAKTVFSSVTYQQDDEILEMPIQFSDDEETVVFPYNTNVIRFQYAAPQIESDEPIQYSYQLQEVDKTWSPWQTVSFKEYNHLPAGKYTFRVRSRSITGEAGAEASYSFKILPLWYQTTTAWVVYILCGGVFFIFLVIIISNKKTAQNKKAWKEEQKARKLLELELKEIRLQADKERIAKEKELLEDDVIFKSKELANYTMLLVKKREVISQLRDDLNELGQTVKSDASKRKVREILHKVNQHMSNEDHLQVFETNFEKVHQDFFKELKAQHPELNQKDLQLCAFVRMNLTNKEISPLLNISVRGVETARYRIRKKLNLEHEHNLVEYLETLTSEKSVLAYNGH